MSENTQNKQNQPIKAKLVFKPVFKKLTKDISTIKGNKKEKVKVEKPKQKVKMGKLDEKFAHIKPVAENHIFQIQDNSIQEYINQCHPDIRSFIKPEKLKSVKALTHGIDVRTKDGLRVQVSTISKTERNVIISQGKKVLFKDKTQVHFVAQK